MLKTILVKYNGGLNYNQDIYFQKIQSVQTQDFTDKTIATEARNMEAADVYVDSKSRVWEDSSDNNTNKTHSRHGENEFGLKLSQSYKRVIQRAVLRKQLKM